MKLGKIEIKSLYFILIGIIFIFLLSTFVRAFSVGFESTELRLYPGESYGSAFSLQNYGTEASDITVDAVVEEGEGYISFPQGTRFDVGANNNAAAPIEIKIPENANVGDSYPVKILFNVISGNVGGGESGGQGTTVSFAFSYRREINLKVIEKPSEPIPTPTEETTKASAGSTAWIWVLVGIVIVVIVVWLILRKKNG